MADINLNAATYEQIVTLLSQLATNYSNLAGTFYDVFYNKDPENVTFQMYGEDGVLRDFTVKNLALSNKYRKVGADVPNENLDKGTIYQDLEAGDLYIKRTDKTTREGWSKLVNSAILDTFILHGVDDPNISKPSADLGTLYVDTNLANLYICVGKDTWAPVSTSYLEYANRNLNNLTSAGENVIKNIITEQVGEKVSDTIDVSGTKTYNNFQYPTALAVYNSLVDLNNSLVDLNSKKQDKSNLVQTLTSASTESTYPSAKCVYDLLGDVEALIDAL